MQIKKYIADNYSEALASIKKEMGSDALIMTTRSIRSDSEWNGSSASQVEITAAIDTARNDIVDAPKIREPEPSFELSDLEGEFDPDIKSLLYSLLSKTERAQSLGLKSDQFGIFSQLTKNGVSEKIIAKILSKNSRVNDGINTTSFVKTKFIETMKRVITCGGGIKSPNK
ncbi:MAG: flagellar biosynthesis protein FlhF, partial [Nitrospinaceae bacterium]